MPDEASVPPKRQLHTNLALLITAPAPSILFCVSLAHVCAASDNTGVCKILTYHPLILVNALFFVNVCVIFWVFSLAQGSTWVRCAATSLKQEARKHDTKRLYMCGGCGPNFQPFLQDMLVLMQLIDPYWTFIPVLIAHFYAWVCLNGEARDGRQNMALALIWLWSIRLSQSYFRRCGLTCKVDASPLSPVLCHLLWHPTLGYVGGRSARQTSLLPDAFVRLICPAQPCVTLLNPSCKRRSAHRWTGTAHICECHVYSVSRHGKDVELMGSREVAPRRCEK